MQYEIGPKHAIQRHQRYNAKSRSNDICLQEVYSLVKKTNQMLATFSNNDRTTVLGL